MDDLDHVVVKLNEVGKGSVSINGHELKSTLGVTIEANANEITVVTVRIVASVEADVFVVAAGVVYAEQP